ncbi:uncharacterized protein LOC141640017 [Silene latifolia]|uniref:uncharacterized protein LOC141640017 n=1 Tax=Silene latifolia TaxID=37657 RepID=UPI003D7752CE
MECVTTPWYTVSLNGSNIGYFQGKRGIRQGDPMSPLLFTICMEYLSRILAFVTNTMEFTYHPLCRALRLNHLCFADDLLMFCRGDKASITIILRAFATFSTASRLEINRENYDIYFNGMCSEYSQYVLNVSGFKEGHFSFRINQICRNCLWSGSEEFHKTPPVGWDRVCAATKYGGLSIMNGKNWNVAMLGKYVWWLAEKTAHLWIRWVNHMYIKGQNWLDYSPTISSSWTWRKICQVKDMLKPGCCHGKWSTNAGVYNVSIGYKWLQGNLSPVPWYPIFWNRLNLSKHSIIGWLAIQCRLMTKDRLIRFGVIADGHCDICLDHPKDHNHFLYGCRFSACCWKLLAEWLDVPLPDAEILDWCRRWRCRSLMKKQIVPAAIMAMIYQIWNARNICRMDNKLVHPTYAVKTVTEQVKSRGQTWKWTSKFQRLHWVAWM